MVTKNRCMMKLIQDLKQNQILAPNMIQSIHILQMSSQELSDYLKQIALENPLMELEDSKDPLIENERLRKLEWLSSFDEQNRIYYKQEYETQEGKESYPLSSSSQETLADNLLSQLSGLEYTPKEYEIFYYITQCLDSKGFFIGTVEEIAETFSITQTKATNYLTIMKNLHPIGVCSSTLQECLLRQLNQEEENCIIEKEIILSHLELLGKNQLPTIASLLKVPLHRVAQAKEKIQTLNPNPGSGFSSREILHYLKPDATVVKLKDYFELSVNDCSYPSIRMNDEYLSMIKHEDCTIDVKHYISDKALQLEQIQISIEKRNSTLLDLVKYLVDAQHDFFIYGKGHLKPVRMSDAAKKLNVHESTISRTVREKHLQCCWGIFPFGYFFSKVSLTNCTKDTSPIQMKEYLKSLIEKEDEYHPWSDQKLSELLKEQGIIISRRTIAKYRDELGILDCRGRKSFFEKH